jgi:hypothetical protein
MIGRFEMPPRATVPPVFGIAVATDPVISAGEAGLKFWHVKMLADRIPSRQYRIGVIYHAEPLLAVYPIPVKSCN